MGQYAVKYKWNILPSIMFLGTQTSLTCLHAPLDSYIMSPLAVWPVMCQAHRYFRAASQTIDSLLFVISTKLILTWVHWVFRCRTLDIGSCCSSRQDGPDFDSVGVRLLRAHHPYTEWEKHHSSDVWTNFSCWLSRDSKQCLLGWFEIYWKRSMVFSGHRLRRRERLHFFPSSQLIHCRLQCFSTDAVKTQFNRDNTEKAWSGFSTSQLRWQTVSSPVLKHGVWKSSTWLMCQLCHSSFRKLHQKLAR